MDIFAEISFGVDFDSVRMQGEHEFSQAFDEVQCFCEKRMYNPMWLLLKWTQLTREEW